MDDLSRDARDRLDPGAIARSASLLLLAAVGTETASRMLENGSSNLVRAHDLLLDILPYASEFRYITTAAMAAAVLTFVVYATRRTPAEVPHFISVIAIMYALRAALIVLTPLAGPRTEEVAMFPLFANGMFPSGHTALALLFVHFTDRAIAPGLRRLQVALTVTVIVMLLLSRGHYSIDIAGGALLAYFVAHEWTRGRLFELLRRYVAGAPSRRRP
ncbi:MAG: phosphatase PAP2-related protein [Coriobacteriia bacterium]|nr:phosphatase PAP2-related protein [Actinomycetota bacterium]MDZ4166664.1 phosphatase PAP2-related protein [Coriobacteriia bacterium]